MKNILYICAIVALSFLVACNTSKKNEERDFLNNCIEQLNISDNYQWVVVLPGAGCHGCIQDGEYFMKRNVENDKILFVLTKISSLKILQQKLGFRINKYSNIYVDKENLFDIPSKNSIYPCVIKLEKGNILTYAFQSPESNAFQLLK